MRLSDRDLDQIFAAPEGQSRSPSGGRAVGGQVNERLLSSALHRRWYDQVGAKQP